MHPMANEFLEPMVGKDVIATVNGPTWKKLHNAMIPAFSWSHIRCLTPVFVDECIQFRRTLDRLSMTRELFSMDENGAKLVFDIIGKVLFNMSLNAQTQGSSCLADLREMIRLAENQLSWNPFVRIHMFFRRRVILRRLNPSVIAQIKERFDLLRRDQVVPSKKDPYSILDLMLREELQAVGDSKEKSAEEIAPEWLDLLLSK